MYKIFDNHTICLIIGTLFLISCGNKDIQLPIEKAKLIDVLCDIHIVEGALQNRPSFQKDSVAKLFYNQVYERHQISEEDFLTSLAELEAHPKHLEQVYAKVLVKIDTLEQESYKSKYKKK